MLLRELSLLASNVSIDFYHSSPSGTVQSHGHK